MGPIERLQQAVCVLSRMECRFAVAGGIAANLFRSEHRLTQDVDLLLLVDPAGETQKVAEKILRALDLKVGLARLADLRRAPMMGKKTTPVVLLVGRKEGKEKEGGVDILLPAMAWVGPAVERAQKHVVDYGFAKLPTITVEDFIVSKAFALRDNPARYKDMDDLQSVFSAGPALDLVYLAAAFGRHGLTLPKDLARLAPNALRRVMKR